MQLKLNGQVAIVTGAGGGLGRAHALALAARGARIVVNDFGRAVACPDGRETTAADAVVAEILAAGGEAIANHASVTDEAAVAAMVAEVLARWGRIDILVSNAGILRDKSFGKMDLADFRLVLDVHLMGAAICCKAVWDTMRAQKHGRIVLTTSSSGLYGNFGQANYGAAKMALVGLMQTLAIEGAKDGIRVNCLAPTAATRMTEGLMPAEVLAALAPEAVSPAVRQAGATGRAGWWRPRALPASAPGLPLWPRWLATRQPRAPEHFQRQCLQVRCQRPRRGHRSASVSTTGPRPAPPQRQPLQPASATCPAALALWLRPAPWTAQAGPQAPWRARPWAQGWARWRPPAPASQDARPRRRPARPARHGSAGRQKLAQGAKRCRLNRPTARV
jgi:NAD(P)-dependent dehydrogenase (short-subunit alcohol dehydrogenase family)